MSGLSSLAHCQLSQYSPGGGGRNSNRNVGEGNQRQGAGQGFGGSQGVGNVRGVGGQGGGQGGGGEDHQGLDWLRDSVPGEPGVDYPVYSLPVPDNAFRFRLSPW